MKPRFEPDAGPRPSEMLIDPEAYDASEQQFAASLEEAHPPGARFVVEEHPLVDGSAALSVPEAGARASAKAPPGSAATAEPTAGSGPAEQTQLLQPQDPDSWRQEVAARLNQYRTRRRPREPRYPSLRLPFEANEPSWDAHAVGSPAEVARTVPATPFVSPVPVSSARIGSAQPDPRVPATQTPAAETSARIIEFPRFGSMAPQPLDELAEPVLDRPRILEAPEFEPPPPALGGILMDPVEVRANEKRPGFEVPLHPAPMARRVGAAAMDAALVVVAFTGFAYVFLKITGTVPPLQQALAASLGLAGLFWGAYQYLLIVYAGTTPGLKLAGLQLSRFDGSPVPRRLRRWRVLVAVLSGLSLGLGYAWCFFDEDQLCWHDRITQTYMAPKAAEKL